MSLIGGQISNLSPTSDGTWLGLQSCTALSCCKKCWLGCNRGLEGFISTERSGREGTAWLSLKRAGRRGGSSGWTGTQRRGGGPAGARSRPAGGGGGGRGPFVVARPVWGGRQSGVSVAP